MVLLIFPQIHIFFNYLVFGSCTDFTYDANWICISTCVHPHLIKKYYFVSHSISIYTSLEEFRMLLTLNDITENDVRFMMVVQKWLSLKKKSFSSI